MVKCRQCRNVFRVIGDALNIRLDTSVMLEMAARSIVEQFDLKACRPATSASSAATSGPSTTSRRTVSANDSSTRGRLTPIEASLRPSGARP